MASQVVDLSRVTEFDFSIQGYHVYSDHWSQVVNPTAIRFYFELTCPCGRCMAVIVRINFVCVAKLKFIDAASSKHRPRIVPLVPAR